MKNMHSILQEIIVSGILIILLVLFLNPFEFWMPDALSTMMMLGLVVIFVIFASFVWKENARDEREGLHKMMADRTAYLVGTALLVTGIIAQSFKHELDPWLVFTLGAIVLAKIIGLVYSKIKY